MHHDELSAQRRFRQLMDEWTAHLGDADLNTDDELLAKQFIDWMKQNHPDELDEWLFAKSVRHTATLMERYLAAKEGGADVVD